MEESMLIELPPELAQILRDDPKRLDEVLQAMYEYYNECDETFQTPQ